MSDLNSLITALNTKAIDEDQLKARLCVTLANNQDAHSALTIQVEALKKNDAISPHTIGMIETILNEVSFTDMQTEAVENNSGLAETIVNATIPPEDDDKTRVIHSNHEKYSPTDQTYVNADQEQTYALHSEESNNRGTDTDNIATVFANSTAQDATKNYFDSSSDNKNKKPLGTGSILKNRFILQEELGHGGMSIVYKALDLRKQEAKNSNPFIAIKVLGKAFKNHPQSIRVLEHESQKIQNLAHPNIITVYDFDRDGDAIYMTMECLHGKSLDVIIKENKNGIPIESAKEMIAGMARGLQYAHTKDIIHSDFKPENVFYTQDEKIKVLDFGIARAKHLPNSNKKNTDFDGSNLGALTPPYASPEMFENEAPDQRDDIYALGCVTYKLLTGRHPYNDKQSIDARTEQLTPKRINTLTRKQWTTLAASLAFSREDRVASIGDFLDGMLPKKRTAWFYAGTAGVAIALCISGYAWYSASQKPNLPQFHITEQQKIDIQNYLETAELYLSMGYLASPPGDSAYDQYIKILDIDPTNQLAIKGKEALAEQYTTMAQEKVDNKDWEIGGQLVKTGLMITPDHEELLMLRDKINDHR